MTRADRKQRNRALAAKTGKRPRGAANILNRERHARELASTTRADVAYAPVLPTSAASNMTSDGTADAPDEKPGTWNRKLTMETAISLAKTNAATELAGAAALFGGAPFVFVVGDASEPLGETVLAASLASKKKLAPSAARDQIRAEVTRRHANNGNFGFSALLTTSDVVKILERASAPEQIAVVVELVARCTTPPPTGHVHVLAIAAGEVLATLVPLPDVADGVTAPARAANIAADTRLEMSPETKKLALDLATEALKNGAPLETGIAVIIDLRHPTSLDFMVALDPVSASDPEGVRERLSAQVAGRGSAASWMGVHQVVDVLRRAGLDEDARARVLGPSPAGEFRIALVGAQTVVTTMPLPN